MLTSASHMPFAVRKKWKTRKYVADKETNRWLQTWEATDDYIHAIWSLYEKRNLIDNTLFVFIGDHGLAVHDKIHHLQGSFGETSFSDGALMGADRLCSPLDRKWLSRPDVLLQPRSPSRIPYSTTHVQHGYPSFYHGYLDQLSAEVFPVVTRTGYQPLHHQSGSMRDDTPSTPLRRDFGFPVLETWTAITCDVFHCQSWKKWHSKSLVFSPPT